MQRFIEHYDHVDTEENIKGIWAVVRCNAVLLSNVPRERAKTKKPVQKAPQMYYLRNKEKILERQANIRKNLPKHIKGNSIYAKYGMTKEEYVYLVEKQGGKCAICGRDKKLVIDHDHETGKVRSLLCQACNVGIGLLQDSPSVLEIAKRYITSHRKHLS